MREDILVEYLSLGYSKPELRVFELVDKMIEPTILKRSTKEGDTIHYLATGNSLFIPYMWIDIFDGLYLYDGNKILSMGKPIVSESALEAFIWGWMSYERSRSLEDLFYICKIGTEDPRKWFRERYELKLNPFKLTTDYNQIMEI